MEVDTEETARVLGWLATTTLEDGVRATAAWFRKHLAPKASRPLSS